MKIYLTDDVHKKYMAYMQLATGEISGIGRSTLDEHKNVIITELWLWRQECTSTTTDVIDHNAMFELVADLVGQGIPMEELNVWWHSHVDMEAFFSGTDKTTINEWVNNRYLVAVVGNRRSEFQGVISIKAPIPCEIAADVEVLQSEPDQEFMDAIQADIDAHVTVKKWAYQGKQKQIVGYKDRDGYTFADEYAEREMEWALACRCYDCSAFSSGKREFFSYGTHENVDGAWIKKNKVTL